VIVRALFFWLLLRGAYEVVRLALRGIAIRRMRHRIGRPSKATNDFRFLEDFKPAVWHCWPHEDFRPAFSHCWGNPVSAYAIDGRDGSIRVMDLERDRVIGLPYFKDYYFARDELQGTVIVFTYEDAETGERRTVTVPFGSDEELADEWRRLLFKNEHLVGAFHREHASHMQFAPASA
jgi:hypothetical protein